MSWPCPSHLPHWHNGRPAHATAYNLPGPQVDPAASYWTECHVPCVVSLDEVRAHCTPGPYPTQPAVLEEEIAELLDLASLRDDPAALVSTVKGKERRAISAFLQLRPQPIGAVFNRERAQGRHTERCDDRCDSRCDIQPDDDDVPVIRTGRELARYFEMETPGLAHRQALNYLLRSYPDWSPPRQALVWMALDTTIYSALAAAWYVKWRGPAGVSFRPRPVEYDYRVNVLFNRAVDCDGDADGAPRRCPEPSPGTPRHPAYPSGHSTYSAAASEILSYFFPDDAAEFDNLANNIGLARLWAGVHWRTDHEAGAALGRCVARRIIRQLEEGCVTAAPGCCDRSDPCPPIPSKHDLDECARACCKQREDHAVAAEARSEAVSGEGHEHAQP